MVLAALTRPLLGRAAAAAPLADFSHEAVNMFGNMRTPAALVAGACLPLGFAFAFPSKEDTPQLRALKRANTALGFLAVNSELLSVVFATNAINRLTDEAGSATVMATSLAGLLKHDAFQQFWLGVYTHFILGIVGLVAMVGIRSWIAIGPRLGRPVLMLTGAILLRLIAACNRSVVVEDFGSGPGGSNFVYLVARYVAVTVAATWRHKRLFDGLSLALLAAALVTFARRWEDLGEWDEGYLGACSGS